MVDKVKVLAALVLAIAETVKESGPEGAPSGVVYAALMEAFPSITLDHYNTLLGYLLKTGKVRLSNHVLYWNAG